MTFGERATNFFLHVFHYFYTEYQGYRSQSYIDTYYPGTPPISKLIHDLEVFLVNTNEFVDYPKLLPPNVVQVGGLQMRPVQPLPQVI